MEKILETMRRLQMQELDENVEIIDVQYIGQIKLDGKEKDIYLIIKQQLVKKGDKEFVKEVQSYVTEEGIEIAGNNMNDRYQFLLVTEKYIDQKTSIEEQLNDLEKSDKLSLNEIENERINEISKTLGITEEQISEIDEINLQQEIDTGKQEKQEKLTKTNLDSLQIKEETNLNQNIKGETLENKLGLKKHGIQDGVKLARVTTNSLNKYIDKPNTQVDAFVVIRKNGGAVVLGEDILEPDNKLGTNPSNAGTTINNDGTVMQEGITSSYRINNGNGNEYLRVSHDETSGKEIKYGMYSPQEGKYVDIELETQRTKRQNTDVRQFMKDKGAGNTEAQDVLKRNEQHEECKVKDVTVIDNDKTNDSHTHEQEAQNITANEFIEGTNTTWDEFATKCGYRDSDRIEKAYKKWKEERNKTENESIDNEDLIKKIEEELNQEYGTREL